MQRLLFALVAGGLFGAGLTISGMIDTTKVQGWLDVFGDWDPTLAFVMGGALIPMAIAWRIAARRWGERLEIQVRDDGVGLATQPAEGSSGIGLGTTRARLQALFGAAAEVKLAADPAGGTMATLLLPFRELAPGAETHAA